MTPVDLTNRLANTLFRPEEAPLLRRSFMGQSSGGYNCRELVWGRGLGGISAHLWVGYIFVARAIFSAPRVFARPEQISGRIGSQCSFSHFLWEESIHETYSYPN